MPNQVKYSTTTPNNSLRKGNVAIGVNNVDMGPTNSTGWYNGITPSPGNYIIYKQLPQEILMYLPPNQPKNFITLLQCKEVQQVI